MSLFVASLSFEDGTLLAAAKVGILLGSTISAVLGMTALAIVLRRPRSEPA
jgi:NhaA family Na+:H+ antiporter